MNTKQKTYIEKPCLRCNNHTLLPWRKSGNKYVSLCDTCKKHTGVKFYDHIDGTQAYDTYLIGGMTARPRKLVSHRLFVEYAKLPTERINFVLDKAVELGIITL